MKILLILSMLVVGCGNYAMPTIMSSEAPLPQYPKKPNQDLVQQIVWYGWLGDLGPAPRVQWLVADCGLNDAKFGGGCWGGMYLPPDNKAIVVDIDPFLSGFRYLYKDMPLSQTSYVHEHIHAWQAARGINDSNHLIIEDWNLVPAINADLQSKGL